MKLGILGTGMIVKDLLTTIHRLDLEEIYILSTPKSQALAEELKEKYQLDRIYYDYTELLNSEADTIYVALPNHLHYSFAKKALQANKHVIMEKPITANSQELIDLMAIAAKNKLMIFEGVNLHYLPSFISLREDLQRIGKIKIVSFNYSQYSSRYDAFKKGTILPAFDYHKSGGALMDINVYNINALVGLFGTPLNISYKANVEKGIDTSGIMVLDYDKFKAVAIGAKDCKAPIMQTIQGDEGVIVATTPISQMTSYKIIDNQGNEEEKTFNKENHRLLYEFQEFIRMIEEKDYSKQKKLLDQSLVIAKIMEKARKQEGIVFDND